MQLKAFFRASQNQLFFGVFGKWRPAFVFKFASLQKFFPFSLTMLGIGLFSNLSQNLDKLIIGKLFLATQLGFYDTSKRINDIASQNLGAIFSKVMFPVLSKLQRDNEKFVSIYRKTIRTISFIVIPLFFLLAITAKPLILILLSEKWLPSAHLLQILAFSGFIYPLSAIMVNAIASTGRADIVFSIGIVKNIIYFIGIIIGSFWACTGVVIAITIVSYLGLLINSYAISWLIRLPVNQQFFDIAIPFTLSVLTFIFVLPFYFYFHSNSYAQLFASALIGFLFYIITNYYLNRKMFYELLSSINSVAFIKHLSAGH